MAKEPMRDSPLRVLLLLIYAKIIDQEVLGIGTAAIGIARPAPPNGHIQLSTGPIGLAYKI